ncbi:MAG: efflux RND transporter permease subunit [Gammaproteobacteria bacterium]|nr:efflux RND transporter permease subunit [Gammaproteobacteria bacterium]
MKNMSAWAIRHPALPIVLFMVLTFIGLVSFKRLPINLNPDLTFPIVFVQVSQPGAAPSEIETQITQKVEGAVRSVADVRNISSRASEGSSITTVEFQIGTPLDRALNDVRDAVSKIRADLPEGVDEPQVNRVDVEGGAIAWYAVSTTGRTPEQLSWYVDNMLSKRLLAIVGVAQVSRGGGVSREIRVELDPARMQALGITAAEVNQQLRVLNLNAPGGRAQVGGGEQSIRVLGAASSALELGATQIRLAGGASVRLQDIAEVRDAVGEQRSVSRVNGRQATSFGVFKARGASDVAALDAVEAEIAKLMRESPDVEVKRVFTTVENTRETYHSALMAMIEGSILAVLVVFIFLRDWRATVISALAIPLSAIPTFAFMYWQDFTLNNISLLALSLVAGVLVDDAIVEIENIVRHMRMGKSGYQAALDAADEIGLAVVATSATIIAVFLPVSFMGGFSGQYFKQFGLTVAAAVFFSLLVARLITPLIAAYTLKPHEEIRSADGPLMNAYLEALRWTLQHRGATLAGGTVFFLLSIGLLVAVPKSLIPPQDFAAAQVTIELPPGVRLEETAKVSAQVATLLSRQPEVTDVVESIGGDDVRSAEIFVSLVPRDQRSVSQKEWQDRVQPAFAQIPDARIGFSGNDGPGGLPITLYLTGEDPAKLEAAARRAVAAMRALPQLRDPRINGDLQRPEILVKPRLDLAAELGVSVAAISQTIRIATLGDLPQNAAKFSLADRQVPIRVSLLEDSRRDLATLENLPVRTASGSTVPLKAVAEIALGEGPSTIRRYNQSRRVVLESELAQGVELGPALAKVYALPEIKNLPEGVRLVEVGQAEFLKELLDNFTLAILAGVLLVFAVLVLLFARVFQPITILSALPLSVGGAVIALMLSGKPFSMPVVIGFLMLMGIVGKNSILLVDFAIEEMRAGTPRLDALLEAGHKRARPIIMTTVAMVAGMLPVALSTAASGFRAPMGIAVIGGLITSTALTLVIVPSMFSVIDDVERWFAPRVARFFTPAEGARNS